MERGVDTEIDTGLPVEPIRIDRKAKEEKRINRMISDHNTLINDLSGDGGAVLRKVAILYTNRLNIIIQTDPECMAYQAIFDDLKRTIAVGSAVVKRKMEEVERQSQRE